MAKKTTPERARLEKAHRLIRSAQHPLLVCHISPDGDAVGSLTGLGLALRRMGREPILACADPIPASFSYIPGAETIVQEVGEQDGASFDLVISLDCSDQERGGRFLQPPTIGSVPLINIDHHVTNLSFGDVALVDPGASSSAEVVLRLLEHMDASLDAAIATALLAGIVSDTRGFRTNSVTVEVMEAALQLMKAGALLPYVVQHSLDTHPISLVHLWGAALSRVQTQGRVIWTGIPLAVRRATGHESKSESGLVSFLLGAEEVDAAAVFAEREDGRIEVSLRAAPGFDVARVALQFGGGGHSLAAGCNLAGPLEEAQARVLDALQAELGRQRQA